MHLRTEKTRGEQNKKFGIEQEIFMESEEELHPIDVDRPDIDKALRECIENLKNEQQKCIQLFYLEEKSYKEICMFLKLDEKKVKSFLQNGKRNLKICLENKNVRQ